MSTRGSGELEEVKRCNLVLSGGSLPAVCHSSWVYFGHTTSLPLPSAPCWVVVRQKAMLAGVTETSTTQSAVCWCDSAPSSVQPHGGCV